MVTTKQDSGRSNYSERSLALVLAGGNGSRLGSLTSCRAKPAIAFGGKYRSIDFPLSNCLHSGIGHVAVLTQYKANSLIRHLQHAWQFSPAGRGYCVELWPAQQGPNGHWYRGTADAVHQNIEIIQELNPAYVIVLAGDHIYKMNYENMLRWHVEHGADATVGAVEVPLDCASGFGIISADARNRIVSFAEKPGSPAAIPGRPDRALASMGVYVFSSETLFDCLADDARNPHSDHDFGRNILPALISEKHVSCYPFRNVGTGTGYWRDIGTVDSYWRANMDLLGADSSLTINDPDWPILTYEPPLPPPQLRSDGNQAHGIAIDSLLSNGCVVIGSTVQTSVLSNGVTLASGCKISDSVILPNVRIGRGCMIRRAIIDRDCVLADGTTVGYDLSADMKNYDISPEGIVLVSQNSQSTHRSIGRKLRMTGKRSAKIRAESDSLAVGKLTDAITSDQPEHRGFANAPKLS